MNKAINEMAWDVQDARNWHPGFSVDLVIFCYHKKTLKVLLTEFKLKEYWSLPGGFLRNDETVEQAAAHNLELRTGLKGFNFVQFQVFSDPNRTSLEQNMRFLSEMEVVDIDIIRWFTHRFISLGFFALVKYEEIAQVANLTDIKLFDLAKLPNLYTDHRYIIKQAFKALSKFYSSIEVAYQLLPNKFTISDLRHLFELLEGKEFDRRNFQRKMIGDELIIQLDERKESKAYNPPFLYVFNKDKIEDLTDAEHAANLIFSDTD